MCKSLGGADMAQIIRKQVYVEPMQDANLKKQAKMQGIKGLRLLPGYGQADGPSPPGASRTVRAGTFE